MARKRARNESFNWVTPLGLVTTAFLIFVWAWAATQGGPPF